MRKPGFMERSKDTGGNRVAIVAAGAGGLALGMAIGAGIVLGFREVMRGFQGLARGVRPHQGDEDWIPPHEAAFPREATGLAPGDSEALAAAQPEGGAAEVTGDLTGAASLPPEETDPQSRS